MALQNDTFVDLKNLTFALIGREYADTTASFGRLKALWNYAAKKAYRQTNYWERFLVFGEARPIANGNTVQQSLDAYNVSGAGTTEANGLYVRNGNSSTGQAAYTMYDADGTTALYNLWGIYADGAYDWSISSTAIDAGPIVKLYQITINSQTPPASGWTTSTGTAPAPTLSDSIDIDTYLRIYLSDPKVSRGAELDFMVNSSGALISGAKDLTGVFVSYKKAYDPDYGNAGDTEAIPSELLPYMAHLAAYTWQRSVEQNSDEANFSLSLALVNSILEDELAKISDQNIANSYLVKNIQTNYNQLII